MRSAKLHYLIYYCVPIIINIVAIFFWYIDAKYKFTYGAPGFSLLFNALIAPIYLIFCNARIRNLSLRGKCLCSIFSIGFSMVIYNISWVITTGLQNSADPVSGQIFGLAAIIAYAIVFIGLIFPFLAHSSMNVKEKSPESSEIEQQTSQK